MPDGAERMNVGFIGIGNMGLPMAARLLEQGWSVAVRDIDPRRESTAAGVGALVRATAAELAARCDCVIVVVVDAEQTEAALFGPEGAAPTMNAGSAVMLCPTIAPADTQRFAMRLAERGIACIDAPMSGGPARARDGSMSLMVACGDAVFERHRALIEVLSSKIFRIGQRPGDGARVTLVNNLLAGITLAGAAEVLALAARIGLDVSRTLDVIEQSSGQSWIGSDRMRRAVAGDLAPRAHTTLLAKDTRLALQMARDAGAQPALGAQAAALFARACEAGLGALDDASLFQLLRRDDDQPSGDGPA